MPVNTQAILLQTSEARETKWTSLMIRTTTTTALLLVNLLNRAHRKWLSNPNNSSSSTSMIHSNTKVWNRTTWIIKHTTCSNNSCSSNNTSSSSNSHHLQYHFSINNQNPLNSLLLEAIKIVKTTLTTEILCQAPKIGFKITMSLVAHRWDKM